jgi:hypothetical protein
VDNSGIIDKMFSVFLKCDFLQPDFLLQGRIRSALFSALSFGFWMELKTPIFIAIH